MRRCAALAAAHCVALGAHPGLPSNQGRSNENISPVEFAGLLKSQIGALAAIADAEGVPLAHVKLHGSLYHLTETSPSHRRLYLETIRDCWPKLRILCLAQGRVATACARYGLTAVHEAFLDRAYGPDGTLVPRTETGALVHSLPVIRKRLGLLLTTGSIAASDGTLVPLHPQTFCIHSDSSNALALLRYCAKARGEHLL